MSRDLRPAERRVLFHAMRANSGRRSIDAGDLLDRVRRRTREGPMPPDAACLKCGYCLRGLQSCRCPECGESFNPQDVSTFRQPTVSRGVGQVVPQTCSAQNVFWTRVAIVFALMSIAFTIALAFVTL